MMRICTKLVFVFIIITIVSCQSNNRAQKDKEVGSQKSIVSHAKRFSINRNELYTHINLNKPWPEFEGEINYVLYDDEKPQVDSIANAIYVKTPVKSIVSNATTIIAFLEILGVEGLLTGFAQSQYIYSPKVRERINNGELKEVGVESKLDVELILELDPDIMMAFSARDENRQLKKLEELGIDIIMNADYMEKTVLGRAEWIKFIGAFVGKEEKAQTYFDEVVEVYDSLVDFTSNIDKPTVFSGSLYGGSWFMPGGLNYGASLIGEAGGDYLWSDNNKDGWLNLDFESVYATAYDADLWIGAADYKSLSGMSSTDGRYVGFRAFKEGNVYSYTNRISRLGGNDYFESGNTNPHLLLADMIKMIHPELLPNYELYYYKKLD